MADRPERMPAGKLGQQGQRIAGARVVFHRARTQRIKLRVDRKVLLRQARVVTHRPAAQRPPAAAACRHAGTSRGCAVDRSSTGACANARRPGVTFRKSVYSSISIPQRAERRAIVRLTGNVFDLLAMHDRVVLIQHNNGAREHAGEWTIHDLHTVVLAETRMADCRQAYRRSSDSCCLLKAPVRERQIVGHHQHREIVPTAPQTYRTRSTDSAQTGRVDADEDIHDLAFAHPVCQRNVLQLRIDQRHVGRVAADCLAARRRCDSSRSRNWILATMVP